MGGSSARILPQPARHARAPPKQRVDSLPLGGAAPEGDRLSTPAPTVRRGLHLQRCRRHESARPLAGCHRLDAVPRRRLIVGGFRAVATTSATARSQAVGQALARALGRGVSWPRLHRCRLCLRCSAGRRPHNRLRRDPPASAPVRRGNRQPVRRWRGALRRAGLLDPDAAVHRGGPLSGDGRSRGPVRLRH